MRDRIKAQAETLNGLVEFDCPFRSFGDGTISNVTGIYAPDTLYGNEIEDKDRTKYVYPFPGYSDWELISGFRGQDSYSGPVMHNSEYLGGGMAEYVLENAGVYVLMAVSWPPENDEDEPCCPECGYHHKVECNCPEDEIEGWVLARLKGD